MQISLKAARVNAGLTQKAAADSIGIDPATLHRWESGAVIPKTDKLSALCNLYGCTIECIKIQKEEKQ